MKIEIWLDFACPFCYMGETLLQRAIAETGTSEKTEITFRSYQLDPKAPAYSDETMQQKMMREHKETSEEADEQLERITKMAARIGLQYNIRGVKSCNTLDAHRLMKYAAATGSQLQTVELCETLFYANFTDNVMLSDREVLADLAQRVGFDRAAVMEMLTGDLYKTECEEDQEALEERKFDYIPYMVFNDENVLQGVVSLGAIKHELA